MKQDFDPRKNYDDSRQHIGYVARKEASEQTYAEMGFKCGLEIHQQLLTDKKLFCHCPCGEYQKEDDFDAEVIRHMRPTLSEMGEYDGTALMERKTRKNIVYRLKNETACTYEIDDTPPFAINHDALNKAIEIALLLKTNVVGELHITRKQYLDGSIPTGFQRTAIVGIEGEIPISNKTIRIIQISIEEDSCREVSDIGHWRVYRTDRLGMPLIESVTYPDMVTPDEAAEAGNYLRFLARSSGKVRTGIGAARQDVNVSVTGGTRVEIKGVAHIKWIKELTHNEAFRQKALLAIKDHLATTVTDADNWRVKTTDLAFDKLDSGFPVIKKAGEEDQRLIAVNLPNFKSVLSRFTQPGKIFADEISGRLKVIACLECPNMAHSEELNPVLNSSDIEYVRKALGASDNDAQIVFWAPEDDVATAIETIEERCRMAFDGVPDETRKSLTDGTTIFERVLPGPDRMYPDTDSAPLSIKDSLIEEIIEGLPREVDSRMEQLRKWGVPEDSIHFILKRNLMPLVDRITGEFKVEPAFVCNLIGHTMKHLDGNSVTEGSVEFGRLYDLFKFVSDSNLNDDLARELTTAVFSNGNADIETALKETGYSKATCEEVLADLPGLIEKSACIRSSANGDARTRWIMGEMRKRALGNVALKELKSHVEKGVAHV